MKKFKFIDEEEELKPGWEQRIRGIGKLPKYEIPKSTKLKFTADIGAGIGAKAEMGITLPKPVKKFGLGAETEIPSYYGISEPKPEEMGKIQKGIISVFGTWESQKRAMPELQKMEDFASKVISEAVPLAQSRYGEEYSKRGSAKEEIAIIHESLTGVPREETLNKMDFNFKEYGSINPDIDERTWLEYYKQEGLLKTLITGPTKGIYDEAEKLQRQLSNIRMRVAEPGKDIIGQIGWVGVVAILGYQAVAGAISVSPIILDKIKNKQIVKDIPQSKAFKAILEVTKGTDTSAQRNLFNSIMADAQAQGISVGKVIRGGYPLTETVPRFAFGAKLYGGFPADKIVKALVETGKISAEISKELSISSPEKVTQVIQNLNIASPAIASKLASELNELKPQKTFVGKAYRAETFIPEHGADIIAKMKTAQEKLDYDASITGNPVFKEVGKLTERAGIDLGKVPIKEMVWVAKDLKTAQKYGDAKEIPIPEDTIILMEDDEGGSLILKNADKYREPVTVGLEEEAKVEAIWAGEEVRKPEPKKEEIPKPEIELATPKQIKQIHAIANSKGMISPKGKMKPQYRALGKAVTDKVSSKKMTPAEAEVFIDALNRLPEPRINKKTGELIPPTIPRTTKLVLQDFFKRKYKEPTPLRYLTPQTYYAEMLGIKPLVEPYEIGKQKFDLEFRKSSKTADQIVDKLNKIAKTPLGEKLKSKVKNIPTKAEINMAGLVDKYEEAPAGLEQGLKDVFNWYRSLSRDILRRENEVRESVDLPPIKYRKAYFRHTADGMAKEMLEGKYPFPQGLKYWAERMVGKKIFNPMEFQRKLSDNLVDLWSKDLRAVTRSMLWCGLKEIHLAQPAKFLSEQLSAISKDLPIYKNLSPEEKIAYDQTRVIPASTKKWLIDYVNQVMKGQETELDASLNRIVTQTGLKGLFNKVLSPFGRRIGRKPITNVFQFGGRVTISGVMGWVPRQIIRNIFQQTQNLALFGVKATLKAFLPASVDKNLKGLLSESLFLKSYTGYEELPTNLMGKIEKVWLGPYGIVAVWNAANGMKAAYWSTLNLIKNPKYKDLGWADPARTKDTPRDKLYPSEKEKLLKEMEFGAGATQYQYIPMGMPEVFRYKALIPATRLQSWWMNYATKFLYEAGYNRFLKGETGYGQKLPWSYRINFAKYIILGGAILTALGYRRSFLLGVAPAWLSPAMQVSLGFYNYAIATSDWQRQRALRQIKYSWTAFIPGSLAWKDFIAVWNGDKDLKDLFFYKKIEKEEKKKVPLKITIPKSGKLKFIEPKIDIKSTKLKFTF